LDYQKTTRISLYPLIRYHSRCCLGRLLFVHCPQHTSTISWISSRCTSRSPSWAGSWMWSRYWRYICKLLWNNCNIPWIWHYLHICIDRVCVYQLLSAGTRFYIRNSDHRGSSSSKSNISTHTKICG
jgi:hypothetical protein